MLQGVRIDVDAPDLEPLLLRLDAVPAVLEVESRKALESSLDVLKATIRAGTPVRTGRLAGSIDSRMGFLEGSVRTRVSYAPAVEGGRGPVVATRARALRFETVTGYIFRRRVGPAEGRHMFREGLRESMLAIKYHFSRAGKEVARFIAGK